MVLEDVGTAGIERRGHSSKEKEDAGFHTAVTLATVLNALDDIRAHHSHILIATTNAKTELDLALTRPGRIDKQFELRNPVRRP